MKSKRTEREIHENKGNPFHSSVSISYHRGNQPMHISYGRVDSEDLSENNPIYQIRVYGREGIDNPYLTFSSTTFRVLYDNETWFAGLNVPGLERLSIKELEELINNSLKDKKLALRMKNLDRKITRKLEKLKNDRLNENTGGRKND